MLLRLQAAVSVIILVLLLMNVDLPGTLARLGSLEPVHGLAALGLYFLVHLSNAAKLRVLMPQRSLWQLLGFTLLAQAYALMLPGQLAGDAVKAFRLGRAPGTGFSRAASTVTFDKVTGLASVLVMLLAGLTALPLGRGAGLMLAALIGIGALAALAALMGSPRLARPIMAYMRRNTTTGWRLRLGRHLLDFLRNWQDLVKRPGLVFLSLAWGLIAQFLSVAGTLMLARGLGIDLSFLAWCVVLGALTIILLAPVALAGLGLREASLIGLLDMFGIGSEAALALGLALLGVQIIFGGIGLSCDLLVLARNSRAPR